MAQGCDRRRPQAVTRFGGAQKPADAPDGNGLPTPKDQAFFFEIYFAGIVLAFNYTVRRALKTIPATASLAR